VHRLEGTPIIFASTAEALYQGDWLLRVIFDRMFARLGVLLSIIVMLAIPVLMCYGAGYVDGTLANGPRLIGVMRDYTLYTLWVVVLTSLLMYYRYTRVARAFFLGSLGGVLKAVPRGEIQDLDTDLADALAGRGRWRYLKYGLVALFVLFWGQNCVYAFEPMRHYGTDIWHSAAHPWGFVVLKFWNFVYTTLLLSVLLYKYLTGLFGLTWLFKRLSERDTFFVRPLFPDNCGGLRPLSKVSMFYMYMLLPFFLIYASILLRGSQLLPAQKLVLAFLSVFLLVTFFLPLGSVHAAMKRAKDSELEKLSQFWMDIGGRIRAKLENRELKDEFSVEVGALEKVDFLYTRVASMPVWPFNVGNIWQLVAAVIVPILIFAAEQALNVVRSAPK
jgi:hypothetical protein